MRRQSDGSSFFLCCPLDSLKPRLRLREGKKDTTVIFDHAREAETVPNVVSGGKAHLFAPGQVGSEFRYRSGESVRVARRNQAPGAAIQHLFGCAANVGGDHGQARGHGFEGGVRTTSGLGDHYKDIQFAMKRGEVGHLAQPFDGQTFRQAAKAGGVIFGAGFHSAGDFEHAGRQTVVSDSKSLEQIFQALARTDAGGSAENQSVAAGYTNLRQLAKRHSVWNNVDGRTQCLPGLEASARYLTITPANSAP